MISRESPCPSGTPDGRQSKTNAHNNLACKPTLPFTRWLLLLALLIAELLAVRLRFDTSVLKSYWWASLRSAMPLGKQLLLAVAAAIAVFGGTQLRDELLSVADRMRVTRRAWLCLPAHFVSLLATALVAGYVLEGGHADSTPAWLWVLLWMGTLVTLGLLAPLAIPVEVWPSLSRRGLPTILFGLAIGLGACAAGVLTSSLWKPLSGLTLRLVAAILAWVLPDPLSQPEYMIVGSQRFHVRIAPACSGYEGMGLICVFLSAYLFSYRRTLRFPRSLILIPIGAGIIWVTNVIRIAALIVIGTCVSPGIAMESFHSMAGWLAFIGVSLGLVVVSQKSPWFAAETPFAAETRLPDGSDATVNPVSPFLGPLVAALATGMVTGAFFPKYDPLYVLSVAVGAGVLWHFRQYYTAWDWSFDWISVVIGIGAYLCWMALIGPPRDVHRRRNWASLCNRFRPGRRGCGSSLGLRER